MNGTRLSERWAERKWCPVAASSVRGQDVLVDPTEPRFTKTADGTHIAYFVMGDGPVDLVYAFGYMSNIDATAVLAKATLDLAAELAVR